jgi:hypothetical protein
VNDAQGRLAVADFPGRPLHLKGALVVFETPIPVPSNIIVFQYNPETMTRTISQPAGGPQTGGKGSANPCTTAGDTRNNLLLPTENYQVSVELDAADQLETSDSVTLSAGLHPALAALEMLMYPPPVEVALNKAMKLFGSAFTFAPQVPLVLFVWGLPRIVPVIINSLTITEQAYDQKLNPILARVDLDMRSMTETELKDSGPFFQSLGYINLVARDVMAHLQIGGSVFRSSVAAAKDIKGMLPF